MYSKISPVAASMIVAAAATLVFVVVINLPPLLIPRPAALRTAMFLSLAAYAGFLARLSRRNLRDLFGPFVILSAVLLAGGSVAGFVIPAAATLSWIRSGICLPGPIARRVFAETMTCAAGLVLAGMLQPPGLLGWVLSVWMFGLIQSLYFLAVDSKPCSLPGRPDRKSFEAAHSRAENLLREQKLARAFEELGL